MPDRFEEYLSLNELPAVTEKHLKQPIRQSFNDLARAFLEDGNTAMAGRVLDEAMRKLYFPHLRPSYTNLQAAEMLLALDKKQLAVKLTKSAFDYYNAKVKAGLAHQKPDNLDLYLLRQSADFLKNLDHPPF
jgi:hypothetical protein